MAQPKLCRPRQVILGKGPWSSAAGADLVGARRICFIFAAGLSVFYGILVLARTWFGPFNPHVEISRDPAHLPVYAAIRCCGSRIAYILSPRLHRWSTATLPRTTRAPSAS